MLQFTNVNLNKLAIHKVGNKGLQEDLVLAEELTEPGEKDGPLASTLLDYFLKPFSNLPAHRFTHPLELQMNESYTIVKEIFEHPAKLLKESQKLARVLFEASVHPKIKSGELYVCYFRHIIENEDSLDAVGIFKSETISKFLQVDHTKAKAALSLHEGIHTDKLDKGCLVLNKGEADGYTVHVIDQSNKSEEAQYWKDNFLQIKPASDEYHATTNILQLTKQFVMARMPDEFEVQKTDQIDYLSRSIEYFKENEKFNIREFEQQVFKDDSIIQSYQSFGSNYITRHEVDIAEKFDINVSAVQKQARSFKSVIKLDKNFHIYVHGNRDLIEQGYDEKTGRKYYKIYYKEER